MRRVITLLLTVAMALSLVVVASASQTVYLRVDEEQSGNTVTYTFSLDASNSNGVGAMEFYVETKGLSLTGKPVYNNRGTQLDAVFKVAGWRGRHWRLSFLRKPELLHRVGRQFNAVHAPCAAG